MFKIKSVKACLFGILIFVASAFFFNSFANNEVDEFIGNATSDQEILLNLEEQTDADFKVIDNLTKKVKNFEKELYQAPLTDEARKMATPKVFTAQIKQGAILKDIKTKKFKRIKRPVIVQARERAPGSQYSYILNKSGEVLYETQSLNIVNIEHTVRIEPEYNPYMVYHDKADYKSIDSELTFKTYFSYQFESLSTEYFATLYRGSRQSASGSNISATSYIDLDDFFLDIGLNLTYQFGYWDDPTVGTVTWNSILVGPSFMRSFWQKKESRWNAHLNFYKSLYHRSEKLPDYHEFSSIGLGLKLEKELDYKIGSFCFGANYRLMRSSLKESTEYLENEAYKTSIASFGVYASYKFDWPL